MSSTQERALLVVVGVINLVVLRRLYIYEVAPRWTYLGFTYRNPPGFEVVVSAVCGLVPVLLLPLRITKASGSVLWIIYVIVVAPSAVVVPLAYPQHTSTAEWSAYIVPTMA